MSVGANDFRADCYVFESLECDFIEQLDSQGIKYIDFKKLPEFTQKRGKITQASLRSVGELSFSDSANAPSKPPQSITKKEAVASEN